MARLNLINTTPDDRAFDLLKAVADHADAHGLTRTAALAEAAMDAWLAETRGVAMRAGRPSKSSSPEPAGPVARFLRSGPALQRS